MPPRRDPEDLNPNPNVERAILVAQQIAAVLPNLVAQIHQTLPNNNTTTNNNNSRPQGNTRGTNTVFTFKHYDACRPRPFHGTEGLAGLFQWFEDTENTFIKAGLPNELKVCRAASVLQDTALTWWNAEKLNRGTQAALALTWTQFKELITMEYCPRNETKKLEVELVDLKQSDGERTTANRIISNNRKRKGRQTNNNTVVTQPTRQASAAPAASPNKKPYGGNFPQCNTCKFHHPAQS